jgi:hypothetical protein
MAVIQFPIDPSDGEHFVSDNRLWVFNDEKEIWELWGNLQYVPVPGDKGTAGLDGAGGDQGPEGARGPRGETGGTGKVGSTGAQGAPGNGINLLGSVQTFEDLVDQKTAKSVNGDVWIVISPPGDLPSYFGYVYNEDEVTSNAQPADYWQMVGPIRGEKGEEGATGPVGSTGPGGDNGADALPGLNGAHGGAFAHLTAKPPTKGPKGKFYLLTSDNTLYITLG